MQFYNTDICAFCEITVCNILLVLKFVKMPEKCVAQFCSNTAKEMISLHKFPKDDKLRRQWRKFVQMKGANWIETSASKLCSIHFAQDNFTNYSMVEMGYQTKLLLRDDAIPTKQATHPNEGLLGKMYFFLLNINIE